MDIWDAIGLIGGVASIAGLIYAIYYARQTRKVKLLVFDTSTSVPLATAVSPEKDYTLSITFKRGDLPEEKIRSAHVRFLRFANLGKEPIRREDIAPANPLAVIVKGSRTLDISLAGVTRTVNKLALSELSISEDESRVEIEFDFLDYQDGGVIKILTEDGKGITVLCGDIIGMPSGIKPVEEVQPFSVLNTIGCSLAVVMQLAVLALMFYTFYWVTGSWRGVYLLVLPFLALFVPSIIFAIVASTIWPDQGLSFPSTLSLPNWFGRLASRQREYRVHAGYFIESESEVTDEDSLQKPPNNGMRPTPRH